MRIAMSGSTGFVGSSLTKAFKEKGWEVIDLPREDFGKDDSALIKNLEASDVVINLAGAPIIARWTGEYKKVMYDSRIGTTRALVSALKKAAKKPALLISTSAVGIYDNDGIHTDTDTRYSSGFLGKLAFDWEQSALSAKSEGIRTVIFRFGIILGANGGALQQMLTPFRLGLGGQIGNGDQAFSWIHIKDLIAAYFFVIENKKYEGIFNLTSPNPTTNKGLTRALGKALHRPAFLRVPAFVLKIRFGEGSSVLIEGQNAVPQRLVEYGFKFRFTEIGSALKEILT